MYTGTRTKILTRALTFHQLRRSRACAQTAPPAGGKRDKHGNISGDALQYVTRPAARKQLAGRGQWVQTQSEEGEGGGLRESRDKDEAGFQNKSAT